ncbi:MAG: hypothetical protein ACK5LN_07090 [Propioniciclava sp.]
MADTAAQRREAAQRMQEMAEATRRREGEAAQVLIDAFVQAAQDRGIPPVRLQATQLDGQRVRTDKTGWYVNRQHSIAIGIDGSWYVLTVPSARLGRLTGAKLQASLPELVVGRGARDGESGDLSDFLARILSEH